MAPLSRTCCGFLKLQLTCKVGTSRVFLRPGLNIGLNHLYGYPVVQVMQRDVPGIDHSFLAMDTEEGVEVVWNEVQFSERKSFKSQEDTVKAVFENLIQLDHANIVNFHKFWTDARSETPRVIFITEYMTSGSLKQFLKKTRKSNYKTLNEKVWKKWLRQILSALSYLHGCENPIVHGNLSCDTIFIQHNGLIKIGSVAPDTIHNHVKTYRDERRNMHFIAPEYGKPGHIIDCAVDIYAFGMCALEMAALELHDIEGPVLKENITKAIQGLEQPPQKDFIRRCLAENPADRPTARDLLLHPSLFEVHSLRLLAAHCMVDSDVAPPDNREDTDPERVLAVLKYRDGSKKNWKRGKAPALELEKYLEEVRNGLFPLTGMQQRKESRPRQRPTTPEGVESVLSENDDQYEEETRRASINKCQIKLKTQDSGDGKQQDQLELLLKLDDKMNRHLMCDLRPGDRGSDMADDLIRCGLINKADRDMIAIAMQEQLDLHPVLKTSTGIRCTEDNDKLHEMLRVVEQIKIARTDRIKKILTGCIRVTETASHDGEVEFISLDAQMMPVFPSNAPPVN